MHSKHTTGREIKKNLSFSTGELVHSATAFAFPPNESSGVPLSSGQKWSESEHPHPAIWSAGSTTRAHTASQDSPRSPTNQCGVIVGLTEGLADGLTDGDAEGDAEGDADGLALGDALGDCEGTGVGDADGLRLGDALGDADGELLGLAEGDIDGEAEGLALGLAKTPRRLPGEAHGIGLALAAASTVGMESCLFGCSICSEMSRRLRGLPRIISLTFW